MSPLYSPFSVRHLVDRTINLNQSFLLYELIFLHSPPTWISISHIFKKGRDSEKISVFPPNKSASRVIIHFNLMVFGPFLLVQAISPAIVCWVCYLVAYMLCTMHTFFIRNLVAVIPVIDFTQTKVLSYDCTDIEWYIDLISFLYKRLNKNPF